jgi:hypothetical protein
MHGGGAIDMLPSETVAVFAVWFGYAVKEYRTRFILRSRKAASVKNCEILYLWIWNGFR